MHRCLVLVSLKDECKIQLTTVRRHFAGDVNRAFEFGEELVKKTLPHLKEIHLNYPILTEGEVLPIRVGGRKGAPEDLSASQFLRRAGNFLSASICVHLRSKFLSLLFIASDFYFVLSKFLLFQVPPSLITPSLHYSITPHSQNPCHPWLNLLFKIFLPLMFLPSLPSPQPGMSPFRYRFDTNYRGGGL